MGQSFDGVGDDGGRHAALLRAYALRWELEEDLLLASSDINAMLASPEMEEWPEVRRAALYAAIHRARLARDGTLNDAIDDLLGQAEADRSPAGISLALAYRVTTWMDKGDKALAAEADADLARAAALLDAGEDHPLERVIAHNRCSVAFGQRRLWELEEQQRDSAIALLDQCEEPRYVAAIWFNQAEFNLSWACALSEIGEDDAMRRRVGYGLDAIGVCDAIAMPPVWKWEIGIMGLMLAAVAGQDRAGRARELLAGPLLSPDYEGHLHLAVALGASSPPEEALAAAEKAVVLIHPTIYPPEHDLALRVAAELESRAAGHLTAGRLTAGLRYGRHNAEMRWSDRLAALAAMEGLVQGERIRAETEILRREAFLDDLTGLANRRGYTRYVDNVCAAGSSTLGTTRVAALLLDVDRFKAVNDRFGHAAGDAVLAALGHILSHGIRSDDLAARLGGDEFVVLIRNADASVAAARAKAILDAIRLEPWQEIHPDLRLAASIGVAADRVESFAEMSARADAALYRAKAEGGERFSVG